MDTILLKASNIEDVRSVVDSGSDVTCPVLLAMLVVGVATIDIHASDEELEM
jgi:hypothetical protein